jgi:hypothetical protein
MHILPKHYYLKRTLFDDKAVEIFLRKKAVFGGKKVKKGHAQTLLSSDCIPCIQPLTYKILRNFKLL